MDNLEVIQKNTDLRTYYEMIAEECSELTKASIKIIRTMYGGNPTDINPYDAVANFNEEITDLLIVLKAMGKDLNELVRKVDDSPKWKRWAERIKDAK